MMGIVARLREPQSEETREPQLKVVSEDPGDHTQDLADGAKADTAMDISETSALIETEIAATLRDAVECAATLHGQVSQKIGLANDVRQQTSVLSDMAETARSQGESLAAAVEELSASNREIGRQIHETSEMTARATGLAEEASTSVSDLKQSSNEIQEVVQLIAAIAKQTNLLALNATIEAARAGEAGRGFAVVAGEVKSLSVETHKATEEIATKIANLQRTAEASIQAVGRIAEIIEQFGPVFQSVSSAVDEQVSTSAELGGIANGTAEFVSTVAERAGEIDGSTGKVVEAGSVAHSACDKLSGLIDTLDHRVVMLLRQTQTGDGAALERLPAEMPAEIHSGSEKKKTKTVDISDSAATLAPIDGWTPAPGADFELDITGIGRIPAKLTSASRFGLNFALQAKGHSTESRLIKCVEDIRQQHTVYIERAIATSKAITAAIENAVHSGALKLEDVFDLDYKPIQGTDPQQFSTRYLDTFDRILPEIQEPALASDPQMVFCATIDRNGYLPVHNAVFAKPQRAGDPVWNAANCRNRRIFDDRAGLNAARNTRPFLVQSYARDMGNGQVVMMKEVDAAIAVFGRHWGGVRMAYRF